MKATPTIWKTAYAFFLLSGLLGVLMRWQFVDPMAGINYKFLLHTHSHVILLGWVFNALIGACHLMLFKDEKSPKYFRLFLLFQLSVLGMLLSFPFQGYAAVSITFSTLHIVLSYVWVAWIWKRLSGLSQTIRKFMRWGLIYLLLSTIGPFSLGPIIASGGSGSDWYYMAIYFYLHFLYNGAFLFIMLGMLFWYLESRHINYDLYLATQFFKLMNVSCVLGLSLSALWMQPPVPVFVIAAIAALLQVLALVYWLKLSRSFWPQLKSSLSQGAGFLLKVALLAFALKVVLQAVSAIPDMAQLAYQVRNYTIAYLHLVFLGLITPFLLAWFNMTGIYAFKSALQRWGLWIYLLGFVLSELVIVGVKQLVGSLPYFELLLGLSLLLWLGMLLLLPKGKSMYKGIE